MIYAAFALVTLAALAVLLYPLLRPSAAAATRADYDLAVYRAQLAEVETDTERGVLALDQANAVRVEIKRRMLDASAAPQTVAADDRSSRKIAVIVLAVVIPLGAGLFYASYGHPGLPDRPYAWRAEHDPAVILARAAEEMERNLAANPRARGYERLAGLYLEQQDYGHAVAALERAIRNGANNAADWGTLGEALVLKADGTVGPQALAAFARALEIDAREPHARLYAGLAAAQIGHLTAAVAIWRDLERDSKPDAPWLPSLRSQIAEAGKIGKFNPATVPPAPPSVGTLAAAVKAMNRAMGTP